MCNENTGGRCERNRPLHQSYLGGRRCWSGFLLERRSPLQLVIHRLADDPISIHLSEELAVLSCTSNKQDNTKF